MKTLLGVSKARALAREQNDPIEEASAAAKVRRGQMRMVGFDNPRFEIPAHVRMVLWRHQIEVIEGGGVQQLRRKKMNDMVVTSISIRSVDEIASQAKKAFNVDISKEIEEEKGKVS